MSQTTQYIPYTRTPIAVKWFWFWGVLAIILIALHLTPILISRNLSTYTLAYELGMLFAALGIPLIAAFITFCATRFKEPIWALMMFTAVMALTLLVHLFRLFDNYWAILLN